jgi:hypothetical protein
VQTTAILLQVFHSQDLVHHSTLIQTHCSTFSHALFYTSILQLYCCSLIRCPTGSCDSSLNAHLEDSKICSTLFSHLEPFKHIITYPHSHTYALSHNFVHAHSQRDASLSLKTHTCNRRPPPSSTFTVNSVKARFCPRRANQRISLRLCLKHPLSVLVERL